MKSRVSRRDVLSETGAGEKRRITMAGLWGIRGCAGRQDLITMKTGGGRLGATRIHDQEWWRPLSWCFLLLSAAVVVWWVHDRTSWYLAIDQFGYLSFAENLRAGRASYPSDVAGMLTYAHYGKVVDVFGQTYLLTDGALYSRYAPGFPILLAIVGALFGEPAAHDVNAVAMGLVLLAIAWVTRRLLQASWLGLAAALMATMLPMELLLWSISPLRDVPCHVLTMSGLALLIPSVEGLRPSRGRLLLAGLLIGYAVAMRVDAILYLVPCLLLLWWQGPWPRRQLAGAALMFLLGVSPLLVYNQIATGNPLLPTQALEFNQVLSQGPQKDKGSSLLAGLLLPDEARAAVTPAAPVRGPQQYQKLNQGGGFRLSHLRTTLPGNLRQFPKVFGELGVALGIFGACLAIRRPILFLATVPYIFLATFFYSFWTRADPRYLAGAFLLFTPLILFGARELVAALGQFREKGIPAVGYVMALLTVAGAGVLAYGLNLQVPSALPLVLLALLGAIASGALSAAVSARMQAHQVFGFVLGVLLVGTFCWRTHQSWGGRASFGAEQVALAQANFEALVEDQALVLTSYRYGRPAENINYYTGADAIYLEELLRYSMGHTRTVGMAELFEKPVYLLVDAAEAGRWVNNPFTKGKLAFDLIRRIPADQSRAFFVASPRHRGIPLVLMRVRMI